MRSPQEKLNTEKGLCVLMYMYRNHG